MKTVDVLKKMKSCVLLLGLDFWDSAYHHGFIDVNTTTDQAISVRIIDFQNIRHSLLFHLPNPRKFIN